MIHFRNKNDIIDWLEKNCPRRAIARALREGQVELLGGFFSVAQGNLCGLIVRVISRFGKTWNVAVTAEQEPQIRILQNVRWEQWWPDDDISYGLSPVYGDNPNQYRKFRDEAKKRMADHR